MPARIQPDMTTTDPRIGEFIHELTTLDAVALEEWAAQLTPSQLQLAQKLMADRIGVGWRTDPASMAHHLTGGEYQLYDYVRLLSGKLVEAVKGYDPRQIWNIPSQYGKTTLVCTHGVPWILEHHPKLRVMYVTYDADKAVEEGGKARDFIQQHSEHLSVRLRPDRRARGMWRTTEGGGLYAVGIYGGIVGYPADVIVMDDLMKGWLAAASETERKKIVNLWKTQIRMRTQGRHCPIISIGTRWHIEDFTGYLLGSHGQWTHIRLPAIAEEHDPESDDPLLRTPDPLGRKPGEVLEARRFDRAEVLDRALELGSHLAAALEQQRPVPEAGNELMRGWFRIELEPPAKADDALSSWDFKMKDKEAGDYVVGQLWWRVGSSYWLMDQIRGQFDHATTANAVALMQVRHPKVMRHVIEAAGAADDVMPVLKRAQPSYEVTDEMAARLSMSDDERAAVQDLRRKGMSGLIGKPPKGDKRVRARAFITPLAEAGNVVLLGREGGHSYLGALLDEVAAFPHGAHDDQVDAMSLGLGVLSGRIAAKVQLEVGALVAARHGL